MGGVGGEAGMEGRKQVSVSVLDETCSYWTAVPSLCGVVVEVSGCG